MRYELPFLLALVSATQALGHDLPILSIADNDRAPGMAAVMEADERRWPDLRGAVWAVADPTLSPIDRVGVASRMRGAVAGSSTQGEVLNALVRMLVSSGAFFGSREDCAEYDECEQNRRIAGVFKQMTEDIGKPWFESGAADIINGFERMIRENKASSLPTKDWEDRLAKARELRAKHIDGVAALRRRADELRPESDSARVWRIETIIKALADHPEEPL